MDSTIFNYSVLQYRHSLVLGESLNIGVLFSFPSEKKFYFVSGNTQRVKCAYPTFDEAIFVIIARGITKKVKADNSDIFNRAEYSFKDYINKEILPEDSSSLQFTEPFAAVDDLRNPKKTIDEFSRILLPA